VSDLDRRVAEIQVPTLTLTSHLRRHGRERVSLVQIDTKGYHCHLVQETLATGARPGIINYEYEHATPAERAGCKHALRASGDRFIDVGRDTLAISRELGLRSTHR
jgi:hypothetical protein